MASVQDFMEEDTIYAIGSNRRKSKNMAPFVNDIASSTVQQIFVRSCLPYKPLDPPIGSNMTVEYHSCEDCGDKFLFASSLKFHVNRYSVAIRFNCKYCSRPLEFYNRCNFLAHLRLHNSDLSEEELAALDITSRPIPHNKIPNNFSISDFLNPTINSVTVDTSKPTCFECKKIVVDGDLKKHYVQNGEPNSSAICNECQLVLPTACSLVAHFRTHSHLSPFMCPDCAIEFSSWDLLSRHMASECYHSHKLIRYKCEKCVFMFTSAEKFFTHIISLHLKCTMKLCHECPHYFETYCKDKDSSILKSVFHTILCKVCSKIICRNDIEAHVQAHAINPAFQRYAYKCIKCNFSCEKLLQFDRHIKQNHARTVLAGYRISNGLNEAKKLDSPRTTMSSPNAISVINRCETKKSILRPIIISRAKTVRQNPPAVLDVDTMPLTPSPEPLVEEDPLLLDSPMPDVNPPDGVATNHNISNISNSNGYCVVKPITILTTLGLTPKNPPPGRILKATTNKNSLDKNTGSSNTNSFTLLMSPKNCIKATSSTAKIPSTEWNLIPTTNKSFVHNLDTDKNTCNVNNKVNSVVKSANTNLKATGLTTKIPSTGNKVQALSPPTEGPNSYIKKKHKCTRCNDIIYFDGSVNPVQRHFAAKHPNYEVLVTKEKMPVNSTVHGRQIILVTQKFKIMKKGSNVAELRNGSGMKTPPLKNGLGETGAATVTISEQTNRKNAIPNSTATEPRMTLTKKPTVFKDSMLTKVGRVTTSKKCVTNKHKRPKKIAPKVTSDDNFTVKNRFQEKSIPFVSSPKRKVNRVRKKKMLDPDFVSNDSDSDYKLSEDPTYSVTATPPKQKVEKRSVDEVSLNDLPTRAKKQKGKSTRAAIVKTGPPEALGSGLVISPSKRDTGSSFLCALPMCQFTSKDQDTFKEHIITHRVDKNTFQCMECGLCFVVKPTFTKHLFIYHQINDAELYILNNNCCDEDLICRAIDFNDYQKIREQNIPTVLLEFQCTICYKPCDDSLSLNSHFRTHGMAFLRSQYMKNKS